MKMGVVLAIKDGMATVLKNGGRFITIPAEYGWQEGDLVSFHIKRKKKRTLLMACFFAIFIGIFGWKWYHQTITLVSIDVNPSIELGLNQWDHVVSIKILNQEAKEIVKGLSLKYKSYKKVVELLLLSKEMESYLQEEPEMVISIMTKEEKEYEILTDLQLTIDTIISSMENSVVVSCHLVNQTCVKEAHRYGITAGKYELIMKLIEMDDILQIEDYISYSIYEIQADIQKKIQEIQQEENANIIPEDFNSDIENEIIPEEIESGHNGHIHGHE